MLSVALGVVLGIALLAVIAELLSNKWVIGGIWVAILASLAYLLPTQAMTAAGMAVTFAIGAGILAVRDRLRR